MTSPHRTARNVAIVSAASFGQIVIQFLFQRILAGIYGADSEVDALAAALALPTLFAAIITGSLSYVLVPELVSKFASPNSEKDGWQLASFIGVLTSLASLAFALCLWGGGGAICVWLYGELDAEQLALTSELLRILSVQVVLSGLISWGQALHHSQHSFLVPALGGVCGTALSLVLANQYGDSGIEAIAWAINAGSLVSVAIHLVPILPRLGRPTANYASLLKLFQLFWPLLLGAVFLRIDPLIDRVLAARIAADDPGAIAYINYAQRILAALLAIGTSGLSVVAFPQLAQRFEGEGGDAFASHFALAFRRLVLIVIPIAIGFSVFSVWIVRDMLQQGEFTSQDASYVGWLIVAMMGMFVGASCGELLARGFYVLGDTRTPTIVGAVALVIGLSLKLALFYWIGIWGIALGVSTYFVLSAVAMAAILSRRCATGVFAGCLPYAVQALLGTLVACVLSYGVYQFPRGNTWTAAPLAAALYFLTLVFVKNPDSQQLLSAVRAKLPSSLGRG